MQRTPRLGLLIAAAATALLMSSTALGAYSPSLTVTQSIDRQAATSSTDITYRQPVGDDALAKLQILSPERVIQLTQPAGTQIGTVVGSVVASAFAEATVPVTGVIVVGKPSDAHLQASAEACTGELVHDTIWLLEISAGGQPLPTPVPLFVDLRDVLENGEVVDNATTALMQLCLPPPTEAPFGIKLVEATLRISGVFSFPKFRNPRWTGINTSYDDATINKQAVDAGPVDGLLSSGLLTRKRKVRHKRYTDVYYSYFARLSGQLSIGPDFEPRADVKIKVGETTVRRPVVYPVANYLGGFTETLNLSKTTAYHDVYTKAPQPLTETTCDSALPLGAGTMPCGTIMGNGFTVRTEDITVTKPKLSHKRIKHGRNRASH